MVRTVQAKLAETAPDTGLQGVLLMRHSAREYRRDIHDLENPLTDHGRELAQAFGRQLPQQLTLRGFASPPHRCVETAELVLQGHHVHGAASPDTAALPRPMEALGVFYALDQSRMWKGLNSSNGLQNYMHSWFSGAIPAEIMMPPQLAMAMILQVLLGRLNSAEAGDRDGHLDLCVSHDMTIYLVRQACGLEAAHDHRVEFLDGLLLYRDGEHIRLRSHHGAEVDVTDTLLRGYVETGKGNSQ